MAHHIACARCGTAAELARPGRFCSASCRRAAAREARADELRALAALASAALASGKLAELERLAVAASTLDARAYASD